MLRLPLRDAECRAVLPSTAVLFTSAPRSSKSLVNSSHSFVDAMISGGFPSNRLASLAALQDDMGVFASTQPLHRRLRMALRFCLLLNSGLALLTWHALHSDDPGLVGYAVAAVVAAATVVAAMPDREGRKDTLLGSAPRSNRSLPMLRLPIAVDHIRADTPVPSVPGCIRFGSAPSSSAVRTPCLSLAAAALSIASVAATIISSIIASTAAFSSKSIARFSLRAAISLDTSVRLQDILALSAESRVS